MSNIISNIKKNYLMLIIVIGLISLSLYSTLAMFTASVNTNDIVNLTASTLPTDTEIIEYERVSIKAGEEKTVEFTVNNSTSNSLYYGVWYEMINPSSITDDVIVAKLQDTVDSEIGQLSTGGSAKVSLIIKNKSSSGAIVNIGVGYSSTSSLNLPTNRYLVTETYLPEDLIINTTDTNKFNNRGAYTVNVNCTNAEARWDYTNWKLVVSSIQSVDNCDTTFTSRSDNLSQLIMNKVGTTQGDGKVVIENGYRYEGKNPNNYVLFNGELWRIIGVFDSNTHGLSGQNLTKIIREESIGSYAWNKSNTNNWSVASLKTILNDYYYNYNASTGVDECYFYSTTVPGNCDFTKTGLNETSRSMIENVTWHLGGHSTQSATASTFYTAERGTTVYGSNSTTTTGYIGLMYPSDYGYSVLASSCARTTNLSSYNSSSCGGESWLLKNGYEWTMTHKTSYSSFVFYVYRNAYVDNSANANYGNAVRPTAYLKSNVYVISGTGSITDPYVIGI